MIKYSSFILATDLSGTFFSEVRSLVIGKVFTSADLAFYSRGQQLPSIVTGNVGTTLISILFPVLAREQENLDNVKLLTKKSLIMLSFVLVPSMFGLVSIMEPLVVLLYTSKWSESIVYAQIICIGSAFSVLGLIPLQVLKAIGKSDVLLQLEFIKKPAYLISLLPVMV